MILVETDAGGQRWLPPDHPAIRTDLETPEYLTLRVGSVPANKTLGTFEVGEVAYVETSKPSESGCREWQRVRIVTDPETLLS